MKPIINLFKHAKKHGWKKTMQDWKYNFIMLESPEQILRKEIIGYIGTLMGLLLASVIFISRGMWFISVIMCFSMLIAYANLKGKLKQSQILKDIKKQFDDEGDEPVEEEESKGVEG